jgi:hypothetical protein
MGLVGECLRMESKKNGISKGAPAVMCVCSCAVCAVVSVVIVVDQNSGERKREKDKLG